jgi:Tfp pilus assembly protein PilO
MELKKRELIINISVIIILVIINLALLRAAGALWSKNRKLKSELNERKGEIAKQPKISVVQETLNLEIEQLNLKLSSIEQRLFSNAEDIFMYINQFAETSRLSLKSIEPQEKIKREIPYSKNVYLELPVKIKLKSDYYQLLTFLSKIEEAQKFIMVSEVKIQGDPKNIWEHDIEIPLTVPILQYLQDK